jgi:hypothetical protein
MKFVSVSVYCRQAVSVRRVHLENEGDKADYSNGCKDHCQFGHAHEAAHGCCCQSGHKNQAKIVNPLSSDFVSLLTFNQWFIADWTVGQAV